MSTVTRFVGLDYHQDSIQVCVLDGCGRQLANRSVGNCWCAVARVVQDSMGTDASQLVKMSIESCSGAAHLADELIRETGWTVTLAHPGIVNRMKQNPDKSDKADAYILADLVRLGYLPRVWLASEEIRQLRMLVRFRAETTNSSKTANTRAVARVTSAISRGD